MPEMERGAGLTCDFSLLAPAGGVTACNGKASAIVVGSKPGAIGKVKYVCPLHLEPIRTAMQAEGYAVTVTGA